MAKKSIVVVGSSSADMIIKVDRIPRPGETLLGGEFMTVPGGKGANQAVAAARAGGRVSFIVRLGRDVFGDQILAGFIKDGLDVTHVLRDKSAPTGVALIFVAKDGENSIAVALGANGRLSPADVKKARTTIASAAFVVMQLETPLPTVQAAAEIAAKAGAGVILNPAPAQPLPDALLRLVSILTPNETEAELLTGIKVDDDASAKKAAEALLARGVQTVIVAAWAARRIPGERQLAKADPRLPHGGGRHHGGGRRLQWRPRRGPGRRAKAAGRCRSIRQCGRRHFRDEGWGMQPSPPKRKEIDKRLRGRAEVGCVLTAI